MGHGCYWGGDIGFYWERDTIGVIWGDTLGVIGKGDTMGMGVIGGDTMGLLGRGALWVLLGGPGGRGVGRL